MIMETNRAYYNESVFVQIVNNDYNHEKNVFNRKVFLLCREKVFHSISILFHFFFFFVMKKKKLKKIFCTATSEIIVTNEAVLKLILSNRIGIGQLFRVLHILPEFQLLDIGKSTEQFWRTYELKTEGIYCKINEVFPSNLFDL